MLLPFIIGLAIGLLCMGGSLYLRLAKVDVYYEQDALSFIGPFYLIFSLFLLISRSVLNLKATPVLIRFVLGLAILAGVINYYLMVFTDIPVRILSSSLNFK
jgi:hypothetical protein